MIVEIKNRAGTILATVAGAYLRGAYLAGADLRGAYLRDADLRGANLEDANLEGANLRGTHLEGANLEGANLEGAHLEDAHLRGTNLQCANLGGAHLEGAHLGGANLGGTHLGGADLRGANLRGANLWDADLRGADLGGVNLGGARLEGVRLGGAKNAELVIARTRILPDVGEIIGWKKASGDRIVQLRIPADVRRSHGMGRKCRAEKAVVVAIFNADGSPAERAVSSWDETFVYEVGATVEPAEPFDDNMWNECSSGIHFYITRVEAENHG